MPANQNASAFDAVIASVPDKIASYNLGSSRISVKAKQNRKEIFTGNLKSYLIAATMTNAVEVRRRADEQNVILSRDKTEALAEQVIADFKTFEDKKGADQILEKVPDVSAATNDLIASLIKNQQISRVIKSFVVGSIKSVNARFTNELIKSSARLVLSNPSLYSDFNEEQARSAKVLLTSLGDAYFFKGLVAGGPETQKSFLKVFLQLQRIIYEDTTLMEVLWSEMTREGDLKDSNLAVNALSSVATFDDRTYFWDHRNSGLYLLQMSVRDITISGSLALGANEFLPHWLGDLETLAIQIGQNQVNGQNSRSKRETQMTIYFSMMKLALDRLDDPATEKLLQDAYRLALAHAIKNSKMVYPDASKNLESLANTAPGSARDLLLKEAGQMKFLADFVAYFTELLNTPADSQSKKYWAARDALDQISFWGFRETQFPIN